MDACIHLYTKLQILSASLAFDLMDLWFNSVSEPVFLSVRSFIRHVQRVEGMPEVLSCVLWVPLKPPGLPRFRKTCKRGSQAYSQRLVLDSPRHSEPQSHTFGACHTLFEAAMPQVQVLWAKASLSLRKWRISPRGRNRAQAGS